MSENPQGARKMLRRCFNTNEITYLQQHAVFQRVFVGMSNLDDCEAAVVVGQKLLDEHLALLTGQSNQSATTSQPCFAS